MRANWFVVLMLLPISCAVEQKSDTTSIADTSSVTESWCFVVKERYMSYLPASKYVDVSTLSFPKWILQGSVAVYEITAKTHEDIQCFIAEVRASGLMGSVFLNSEVKIK